MFGKAMKAFAKLVLIAAPWAVLLVLGVVGLITRTTSGASLGLVLVLVGLIWLAPALIRPFARMIDPDHTLGLCFGRRIAGQVGRAGHHYRNPPVLRPAVRRAGPIRCAGSANQKAEANQIRNQKPEARTKSEFSKG